MTLLAEPTTAARTPVIYRPESAVFWVYVAALGAGIYLLVVGNGAAMYATLDAQLVLGPIWMLFVAALVWLMFRFDPMRSVRRVPQGLLAGTALGATTAVVMAMNGNTALQNVLGRFLNPDTLTRWSAALTAPLIEEASKATCAAVVLVLGRVVFHRISHALMVGMFVGLGFDVVEDLTYATMGALNSLDSDVSGASGDLILRILTAIPSHWAFASLSAVGVLLLLPSFSERAVWPRHRRILVAVALFLSAWFMHFLWDAPGPDGPAGAGVALLKVVVNLAIFLGWALWLLRFERRWLAERIAALPAGVSASPELLASLGTRRRQRRLQRHARRTGGRPAARAVRREQRAVLDEIQSAG